MKADLPKMIRKVAQFLDRPLTDEQVQQLTEHLSFEKMKNNTAVNKEPVLEMLRKYKLTKFNGVFMRAGKVGSYENLMSPELFKKFEKWTKNNIKGTDYVVRV